VSGLSIFAGILVLALSSYYLFPLQWAPLLVALERRRSGLATKHVTVDGRTFCYLEGGRGLPVVMLHGFGGSADHWTRMAGLMVKQFRVVAPDLPGFGDTTASASERFSVPLQAERLHAFLQALGLRRYHVIANSMGGNIAGALAHDHPDEVMSLTLLEPQGIESRTPTLIDLEIREGKQPLIPKTPEEFARLIGLVFTRRPFIPRAVYLYLCKQALAREPLYQAVWKGLWEDRYPLERNLPGIRAPTLVIWGDSNHFLHETALEKVEQGLRDVRVVRMKSCGHTPMVERPAEVWRHFEEFVARLGAGDAGAKVSAP
jgi:abhydrolase domain-containing protein 6